MEHNKCKKSAVEYFPDNRVDISLNNDDALNETMEKELDNTHGYSRAHLTLRAVDVVLLTFWMTADMESIFLKAFLFHLVHSFLSNGTRADIGKP